MPRMKNDELKRRLKESQALVKRLAKENADLKEDLRRVDQTSDELSKMLGKESEMLAEAHSLNEAFMERITYQQGMIDFALILQGVNDVPEWVKDAKKD